MCFLGFAVLFLHKNLSILFQEAPKKLRRTANWPKAEIDPNYGRECAYRKFTTIHEIKKPQTRKRESTMNGSGQKNYQLNRAAAAGRKTAMQNLFKNTLRSPHVRNKFCYSVAKFTREFQVQKSTKTCLTFASLTLTSHSQSVHDRLKPLDARWTTCMIPKELHQQLWSVVCWTLPAHSAVLEYSRWMNVSAAAKYCLAYTVITSNSPLRRKTIRWLSYLIGVRKKERQINPCNLTNRFEWLRDIWDQNLNPDCDTNLGSLDSIGEGIFGSFHRALHVCQHSYKKDNRTHQV